jgi:hypothetical protein
MTSAENKRWYMLVTLVILFVCYLLGRDTVRVEAHLTSKEVEEVVGQAQEWSSPKFFRHIEVRPSKDGGVGVWIREPGGAWSVTWFTNISGSWKKAGWYLLEEDKLHERH